MRKLCTVAQVKNQLTTEAKRNDLERFFDAQIATFKDRGIPERVIDPSHPAQNQKSEVVRKASGMIIGKGNIPFLPVVKPVYLGYYGLMAMIQKRPKENYVPSCFDPTDIFDVVDVPPKGVYYIYDVEDGSSIIGKSPRRAEKILKNRGRSPLTAIEVVNLCVLRDVLSKRHVWAVGSRYEFADVVPYVYLYSVDSDWPEIGGGGIDDSRGYTGFGSPSCGSR